MRIYGKINGFYELLVNYLTDYWWITSFQMCMLFKWSLKSSTSELPCFLYYIYENYLHLFCVNLSDVVWNITHSRLFTAVEFALWIPDLIRNASAYEVRSFTQTIRCLSCGSMWVLTHSLWPFRRETNQLQTSAPQHRNRKHFSHSTMSSLWCTPKISSTKKSMKKGIEMIRLRKDRTDVIHHVLAHFM